jgi:hypothetical protein
VAGSTVEFNLMYQTIRIIDALLHTDWFNNFGNITLTAVKKGGT